MNSFLKSNFRRCGEILKSSHWISVILNKNLISRSSNMYNIMHFRRNRCIYTRSPRTTPKRLFLSHTTWSSRVVCLSAWKKIGTVGQGYFWLQWGDLATRAVFCYSCWCRERPSQPKCRYYFLSESESISLSFDMKIIRVSHLEVDEKIHYYIDKMQQFFQFLSRCFCRDSNYLILSYRKKVKMSGGGRGGSLG